MFILIDYSYQINQIMIYLFDSISNYIYSLMVNLLHLNLLMNNLHIITLFSMVLLILLIINIYSSYTIISTLYHYSLYLFISINDENSINQ
jgi:hypothetical protein